VVLSYEQRHIDVIVLKLMVVNCPSPRNENKNSRHDELRSYSTELAYELHNKRTLAIGGVFKHVQPLEEKTERLKEQCKI